MQWIDTFFFALNVLHPLYTIMKLPQISAETKSDLWELKTRTIFLPDKEHLFVSREVWRRERLAAQDNQPFQLNLSEGSTPPDLAASCASSAGLAGGLAVKVQTVSGIRHRGSLASL